MSDPNPRVRVASRAKPGEVLEVRTLITHPMESGQRRDAAGNVIPRKIIRTFTASFNGRTFFEADWRPAIAANPFQTFHFRATESGEFRFVWLDDDGSQYVSTAKLAVG